MARGRRKGWHVGRNGADRGAAALEFALIVPVLLLFLYAIIQYGTVFLLKHDLTQAAADAARSAVSASQSAAQGVALGAIGPDVLNDSGGLISRTNGCSTSPSATTVCTATVVPCPNESQFNLNLQCLTVSVTYHYERAPVMPSLFGIPVPSVTSSSTVILTGSLSQ